MIDILTDVYQLVNQGFKTEDKSTNNFFKLITSMSVRKAYRHLS